MSNQRTALIDELTAIANAYATTKDKLKAIASVPRESNGPRPDLRELHRELGRLKKRQEQLRKQLAQAKQAEKHEERARQYRREELFIDVARKRLGEVEYQEVWAEVDRLEREQWQTTWKVK